MTAPEGNGDHGQHGRRRHGFMDLLRWCKRRASALFTVMGAWLAAIWRSAGAWREHLLAAWAEARSSLWRRRWFGEYWRALVQRAGRGPARRFAFTALIATIILTGSGGLFLTNVL